MAESVLEALLAVQAHDVVVDQLRHRRGTLGERVALQAAMEAAARLDRRLTDVAGQAREIDRRQRRLEDEVETLAAKRAGSERRLFDGSVQSPRELEALSQEVDGLSRRSRGLEDELLELMEAAEVIAAEAGDLQVRREESHREVARLATAVTEREAEIDGLLASEAAARDHVASGIPSDLLGSYEQLRRRLGGVAVARLESGRCTGCHLALPAVELDALRRASPSTLVRHEECGRILVP